MKVLWFSVTPSLYNQKRNGHNGGGWIESLERIIHEYGENIQLGIAFCTSTPNEPFKSAINGTVYYPMGIYLNEIQKIKGKYTSQFIDKIILEHCCSVIDDFRPDIIHVFGSEWCFGLINEYTNIPVVIHMQGCWPPYRNASFPPGFSKYDKIRSLLMHPKGLIDWILYNHLSKERALREERILRDNKYYMGRTRWDEALTYLYNRNRIYFYCSEALRSAFVEEKRKWELHDKKDCIIVTIGAGHMLKGYDVVLKAAKLLKENAKFQFEWLLCGPTGISMKVFEQMTGIRSKDVNVKPLGRCSASTVKDTLLGATMYVHTSYIDNSPNSLCEAQILGLPVIATNVGGISSLFSKEYPQGMLVPTNDPYYLAAKIIEVFLNEDLQKVMSDLNYKISRVRHDDSQIFKDLCNCYNKILEIER